MVNEDFSAKSREQLRTASTEELRRVQLQRLNRLLEAMLADNAFYQQKWQGRVRPFQSLEQLAEVPLLTKSEIVPADSPPSAPARFHTYPSERYVRFHRTSGTSGRPLPVLDTAADWRWWIGTWQYVLDAADVTNHDRALMAFSFGPFIGFWSANDALVHRGCLVIPGGGMSTAARLQLAIETEATVLCCTPTYALHLAAVAKDSGIDIAACQVRKIIVAGEPGGSIPEIRERIETAWEARVIDHAGASELGPWGVGTIDGTGLHVIEPEFIAEVIDQNGNLVPDGEMGELVLTGLGRFGCPAIRYRTGDLVRLQPSDDPQCRFVTLAGGVLGRADDMLVIRGVNIFPSSIDAILCQFPEVEQYRMTAWREGSMDQLRIDVEGDRVDPRRIASELEIRLALRVEIRQLPSGTLPAYTGGKAQRLVDNRKEQDG